MFGPVLARLEPFAQEFSRRGKKLYLVGGAVRNLLLGRPVKDFDFTTDALPSEVQGYFPRVLPTGLQHGTVTVLFRGEPFEVTTFRIDGDYADGRRPDAVVFTPSLEEDLCRRDFTINAMALDLTTGALSDPHDGQGDLARRLLRAIGNPGTRFDEDALRLLRLFRFASQLGFAIEPATWQAVGPRRPRLAKVSKERIKEELSKAMAGGHPDLAWGPLASLGFLSDLFGEADPRALSASELALLVTLPADLRWSFWLTIASSAPLAVWERVLKGLTFSNAEVAAALGPPQALGWLQGDGTVPVRAKAILEAWGSRERMTPGVEYLRALEATGWWTDREGLVAEVVRACESGEPIYLKELAIGGRELLEGGIGPGPKVGAVLRELLRQVWARPDLNEAPALLALAHQLR